MTYTAYILSTKQIHCVIKYIKHLNILKHIESFITVTVVIQHVYSLIIRLYLYIYAFSEFLRQHLFTNRNRRDSTNKRVFNKCEEREQMQTYFKIVK